MFDKEKDKAAIDALTAAQQRTEQPIDGSEGESQQTDYYQDLKNESYKAMLSKEVQASVAQDQARKYTQNALAAAGYGTQGIAESSSLGIGNKYMQALTNAQNEYTTDINNINQQQRAEQLQSVDNNYQEVVSMLSGVTTAEQLQQVKDYAASLGFDDKTMKQLDILYSMTQANNGLDVGQVFNYQKNGVQGYYDKYGDYQAISLKDGKENGWNKETDELQRGISTGTIANNSYIKLTNQKGNIIYVRYYNGQLYYATPKEYQNAGNRWDINRGSIKRG